MTLNSQEISKLLPHRYPFLLVDRVLELTPGEYCKAVKNVTVNEPFFPGHFPEQAVMPGVLILESLAQSGALILYSLPEHEGKMLYLAGAEKVRFKKPVVPGDVLVNEVKLLWYRRGFGRIACTSSVNDEEVAEAEMLFSLTARY
ncbi:MAG: 3-hydroxyacyl-ACP dehydratase FabZ [Actinomycetota bacterium]